MGLIIVLLVCIGILFWGDKLELVKKRFVCLFLDILAVLGVVGILVFLISVSFEDEKHFKYNKEELKEVIQLEELEANDIFVNYSYSDKEYSYKIATNAKEKEIGTISAETSITREVISEGEEIRIEHYKLTAPKSFWIKGIPWIAVDKYIIYVPEENMINRTN